NYTGWRVSGAGDVNGDGYDDFLIGAPYHDENDRENGKVYLILGRTSGWKTQLAEADASYYGEGLDDEAGWDTQGAGDVDGDGYDDFLIGAWYNDANGTDAGKLYLIRGKPSGWQPNVPLATIQDYFVGEHAGDYAGFSCATAGDVNGDCLPDIITSATYYSEAYYWGGIIYLFASNNTKITVTAPNGGETWTIGNNYHITWSSSHTSGSVKLEYSPNNGGTWKTIVGSTPDDGDFLWTIPDDPTTSCLVRITDTDGDPSDVSDATFSITPTNYTLTMAVEPIDAGTTDPPPGNHSYGSGSVVTIIAIPATGYNFDHWSGDVADSHNDTTTVMMNANKTITAHFVPKLIPPITDLRASQQWTRILLEWSPVAGATGYNVYRGTSYDFLPDKTNGSNRIATNVSDQDPNTNGIQWLDNGAGVRLVGDVNINYFYRVTALVGSESDPSNLAGEFDYKLSTTSTTDINHLVVIMHTQGTRKPIATAEDLAQAIPYCTDVYCWDAATQGLTGHVKGLPFNNFPIAPGYPYMINVSKDTIWTIAGSYSDTCFQLINTNGTDINLIGVPLSKSNLTTADQLGQDIPNCSDVYVWDVTTQALIGHVVGLPFNDFSVQAGHAYFVNVTSETTWPASCQGSGISASSIDPIQSLPTFQKGSAQSGNGVPHTIYGRLIYPSDVHISSADLRINVVWRRNGDQKFVSDPLGSGNDGKYWWVMVPNFLPTWQPGDTLIIEIFQSDERYRGVTQVILSDAGSDDAGTVHLNKNNDTDNGSIAQSAMPYRFHLWQNSPNPFNPETAINFECSSPAPVKIKIYDVAGRLVTTLVDGELAAGYHRVVWDGRDHKGEFVSSGIYFCRMETGDYFGTIKLLLTR
ncbi:MAG: T9SS type A sorting domain-containing protein, partial [candidate division KSB1 bacterium]|nr:T9SS type A sorting domain-containing protein [candidate division KSB1 bacterium]